MPLKTISKGTYEFIRTKHPRVATFYSLTKIHKLQNPPPGQPIVSGNGSIAENLSRVVDTYLQPYVVSLPSFVKDTIHLLQIIDGVIISDDSILVGIDVEALYSSNTSR